MLRNIMFFLVLTSCVNKDVEVETVAIVNNAGFKSNIFIFFEQDTVIGNIYAEKSKYFFKVQDKVQIFTLKEKLGKGNIEYYNQKRNNLEQVFYHYPMGPKNWKDSDFQIAGGALREIYNFTRKKNIQYITFRSDYVKNLNNNWKIPDEEVMKIYKYIHKDDSLTTIME